MNLPTFISALDNRIPLHLKSGELAIISTSYTKSAALHGIDIGPAVIWLTGEEAIAMGTALIQAEHHRRALLAQYQEAGDAGVAVPA